MKMVFFLQVSYKSSNYDFWGSFKTLLIAQADASPASLEKYLYYGCYCFPDGDQKLFSGFGDPIDEVDKVCRRFQTCYRCVGVDYGQEECINTSGEFNKVGCVFPMVVVSILHHTEFGRKNHREDASHFIWNSDFYQ